MLWKNWAQEYPVPELTTGSEGGTARYYIANDTPASYEQMYTLLNSIMIVEMKKFLSSAIDLT